MSFVPGPVGFELSSYPFQSKDSKASSWKILGKWEIQATNIYAMSPRVMCVWPTLPELDNGKLSLPTESELVLADLSSHLLASLVHHQYHCLHQPSSFHCSQMDPCNHRLDPGNPRPKKTYTVQDGSTYLWKLSALMVGCNPCRQLRGNLFRSLPASLQPAHSDYMWPAEIQSISHLPKYVKIANTAVKQAQLKGMKVG